VVDFKAVIKDQAGNPVSRTMVELKTTDDEISSYGYGYTDNNGMVSGKVPAGKSLQMRVQNNCNNSTFTQNIGPFTGKADLGTVTVNSSTVKVTISGTAVTCKGSAVTNGFVDVKLDGQHNLAPVTNGNFSISLTRCSNVPATAEITAYDMDASQNGAAANITVTAGTITAGQLLACGNALTQYVNITLNGAIMSFVPPADSVELYSSITSNDKYLWATRRSSGNEHVYVAFTAAGTGSAPVKTIDITKGNTGYIKQSAVNMTITEFGPVGGYISGSLSTTLKDSSNNTAPVTLTFRAKRAN
jgi:hypothetical protein